MKHASVCMHRKWSTTIFLPFIPPTVLWLKKEDPLCNEYRTASLLLTALNVVWSLFMHAHGKCTYIWTTLEGRTRFLFESCNERVVWILLEETCVLYTTAPCTWYTAYIFFSGVVMWLMSITDLLVDTVDLQYYIRLLQWLMFPSGSGVYPRNTGCGGNTPWMEHHYSMAACIHIHTYWHSVLLVS